MTELLTSRFGTMSRLEIFVVLFIKLFQSSRSMVLKDMTQCLLTRPEVELEAKLVKGDFFLPHPDKPNFSPENQFSMSSLAPRPILAKLSYNKDIEIDNYKLNLFITEAQS